MALAWLDETGLHLPDYPTILEYIQGRMRAIHGDDLYLEPDSQDGQMVAIFAGAIHDAFALAGSVYNAFAPTTAQGVSLSRQVAINGLRRQAATTSTVTLRVVGSVGTVLRGAVAKDSTGRRWLLPEVTIPIAGEALVTATAEVEGAVTAPAGDITRIDTPILGWHSVTNPAAAVAGADVEGDAALRRRQKRSTALPSRTVFEGTIGAVEEVPGVTRARGYENDTDGVDDNGLPRKSIALVVEGGDDQAIAVAIAAKKGPGCGTHGTSVVTVTDRYGSPAPIRFFRPTVVAVRARIVVRPLPGYLATTGEDMRTKVAAEINGLRIGEDVLLSKLYSPINGAEPVAGVRTFDVLAIELAAGAAPLAAANVQVAFNAAASCALANVTVEVAP